MLSFELSAPSEDGCGMDTTLLPTQAPCTVVRVFRRRSGGQLEPVTLFRPGGDRGASEGSSELRFDSRRIVFETPVVDGQRLDLQIAVYVDRPWAPAYGALLENVRLDRGTVRVRLHPYRRWACPGPLVDAGELAPRALHRAVQLDDGNVVFLGGITGQSIDPAGVDRAGRVNAQLQPILEMYDVEESRFRRVSLLGESAAFARVLFDAYSVGREPDGRHRIRVVGGIQASAGRESAAVLAFDNSGLLAPLGLPFAPTEAAEAAPNVDLLLDPVQLTAQVTAPPLEVTGRTRGGAITVSDPLGGDTRVVLMGLTVTGGGWLPSSTYFVPGGTGATLVNQRIGATITALPAIDRFFAWGGNLSSSPEVLETAGELIRPGLAGEPLASTEGLPGPVAFHTAHLVGGRVVMIGGLAVEASGALRATPPADPIVALEVAPAGFGFVDVADVGYEPTFLHTSTDVPGVGIVIVGGASVRGGDRLTPVASVGHVGELEGALVHDGALQDLSEARFAHTATLLPGRRLLVVGGLGRDVGGLRTLPSAELMLLDDPPHPRIDDGQCVDVSSDVRPDAGSPRLDADVPRPDAGVPAEDAGGPEDAG